MRYQLGQIVPIVVQCLDENNSPAFPDDCPQLKVWSGSGLVFNARMPCEDRFTQTGVFLYQLFLGIDFEDGFYNYTISYKAGDRNGIETGSFTVVEGGNKDGDIVSMYFFERPQARWLVQELNTGTLVTGRNPQ